MKLKRVNAIFDFSKLLVNQSGWRGKGGGGITRPIRENSPIKLTETLHVPPCYSVCLPLARGLPIGKRRTRGWPPVSRNGVVGPQSLNLDSPLCGLCQPPAAGETGVRQAGMLKGASFYVSSARAPMRHHPRHQIFWEPSAQAPNVDAHCDFVLVHFLVGMALPPLWICRL